MRCSCKDSQCISLEKFCISRCLEGQVGILSKQLLWVNDSRQLSPTQMLAHHLPPPCPYLPSGMGERTIRTKMGKLMGWDKASLTGKTSACLCKQSEEQTDSQFPRSGRCSAISRKVGSFMSSSYLERQTLLLSLSSFPTAFLAKH